MIFPGFLIRMLARWGVPQSLRKPLVVGTACILLVIVALVAVKIHDRRVIATHAAKQDAANAKADRQADAHAAEQRRADDQRTADEIQQVKEAINEAGNDPAARRRAYYRCVGLQQAARANREQSPEC